MLITTNTRFNFSISQIAVNHAINSFESGISALVKYPQGEFILRAHIGREGNYAYHAGPAQVEKIIDAVKLHFEIELKTKISVDSVQIHPNSISVRAKKVVETWDSNVEYVLEVSHFVLVDLTTQPPDTQLEVDGYLYNSVKDALDFAQGEPLPKIELLLSTLKIPYQAYTCSALVDLFNAEGCPTSTTHLMIKTKSLMVNV